MKFDYLLDLVHIDVLNSFCTFECFADLMGLNDGFIAIIMSYYYRIPRSSCYDIYIPYMKEEFIICQQKKDGGRSFWLY